MGQSSTCSQKPSGLRFAMVMAKESGRYRRLYGWQWRSTMKSNAATPVWAVFRDVEAADRGRLVLLDRELRGHAKRGRSPSLRKKI